jgi:hypothetical protein
MGDWELSQAVAGSYGALRVGRGWRVGVFMVRCLLWHLLELIVQQRMVQFIWQWRGRFAARYGLTGMRGSLYQSVCV